MKQEDRGEVMSSTKRSSQFAAVHHVTRGTIADGKPMLCVDIQAFERYAEFMMDAASHMTPQLHGQVSRMAKRRVGEKPMPKPADALWTVH